MPADCSKPTLCRPLDGREICVFSGWPLFTITVESLIKGGDQVHFHAGGQAMWIARMIRGLGHEVTLVGPFGGDSRHVLERLIEVEGIRLRSIPVQGANGGYVHDRRSGHREEIASVPPPSLDRHEVDDLYDATLTEGIRCGTIVITGVPDNEVMSVDFFTRIVKDLRSHDVNIIADVGGTVLEAIEGGVTLLRASFDDLQRSGLVTDDSQEQLLGAIRKLQSKSKHVVAARAGAGCFAQIDGQILEASLPELSSFDDSGAGDSMTAALAVAVSESMTGVNALRMAAAAAALNVTRRGRGTGKRIDIEVLAQQVTIRTLA